MGRGHQVSMLVATSIVAATAVVSTEPQRPVQETPSRAVVEAITTAVRVLDARGQFVPDLRRDEFSIYEDGVEQAIDRLSSWVGGRSTQASSTRPADQAGRVFIVFIDDMHLQTLDTPKVRRVLEMIRDNLVRDEDLVGLISTGGSSVMVDLTLDRGHVRFNDAIGKVMGSAMSPYAVVNATRTPPDSADRRANAHTAFQLANAMLEKAAAMTDRRKSFIYVSSGYDFNPFTESRSSLQGTGGQGSAPDLVADLASLVRAARRANVVFYPIDPRGLLAGTRGGTNPSPQQWSEFVRTSISSLQVLASETGGFCICNTNDFGGGLERISAETGSYYVLGYSSTSFDSDRVRRQIRIEVTRPGDYRVIYPG